ncbi:MAG: hypothetical protein JSR39_00680 [Verrucomicrobia bacterium]|nr:hypothetical protein [Verrucomicrobiota bacterium]
MQHVIIGIPLPDLIKKNLLLQCCGLSNAHWVEPEQLHLSLIDAGKRNSSEVLDMINVLQGVALGPFSITLEGIASISTGHGSQVVAAQAAVTPA